MSNAEESAMDALVNEVMNSRNTSEAAAAPAAASEPAIDVVVEGDNETKVNPVATIGFADAGDENSFADATGSAGDNDLATVRADRDGYLADSQRLAADFANYRKQADKRVSDAVAAQSAGLVRDLIPVLDACDAALIQDPNSAAGPIRSQLITELEKNGLELLAPVESEAFDPEQHEAVIHEPAGDGAEHDGPVIGEVLRAGYLWKGRVVRPAMVKVVG